MKIGLGRKSQIDAGYLLIDKVVVLYDNMAANKKTVVMICSLI